MCAQDASEVLCRFSRRGRLLEGEHEMAIALCRHGLLPEYVRLASLPSEERELLQILNDAHDDLADNGTDLHFDIKPSLPPEILYRDLERSIEEARKVCNAEQRSVVYPTPAPCIDSSSTMTRNSQETSFTLAPSCTAALQSSRACCPTTYPPCAAPAAVEDRISIRHDYGSKSLSDVYCAAVACGQKWAEVIDALQPLICKWLVGDGYAGFFENKDLVAETCFLFARALANSRHDDAPSDDAQIQRISEVCCMALEWSPAHRPSKRLLKRMRMRAIAKSNKLNIVTKNEDAPLVAVPSR